MALFVSSYTNKIDRKGRVSVPAQFRQILNAKGSDMVVLYPHQAYGAIEGSGMDWLEDYAQRLAQLPEYDEERNSLLTLFADVVQIAPDGEGRIILPEALRDPAGIGDTALFVGAGLKFEIWDPARYAEHKARMAALKRERSLTVPPLIRAMGTAS
ncbi:MAG: division/cell wall cluster transcriptional repressor MraZ [Stellaceae bacterium]